MTSRSAARRELGRDAVLSISEVVELLPFRDDNVRTWLREQRLVRNNPKLGEYVLWADVLDALRVGDGPQDPEPRPPSGYPRAGLRGGKR